MGYIAVGLVFAGCLAALAGACTVCLLAGGCVYAFLEREFKRELARKCFDVDRSSYERGRADGERLRSYSSSELPKSVKEAEESRSWAEGLAALYPQDPELKAELERVQKERTMLKDGE